jgi:hypothetical protein
MWSVFSSRSANRDQEEQCNGRRKNRAMEIAQQQAAVFLAKKSVIRTERTQPKQNWEERKSTEKTRQRQKGHKSGRKFSVAVL